MQSPALLPSTQEQGSCELQRLHATTPKEKLGGNSITKNRQRKAGSKGNPCWERTCLLPYLVPEDAAFSSYIPQLHERERERDMKRAIKWYFKAL